MGRNLEPHEIALLLLMYDRGIVGKAGYINIAHVASRIKWQKIQSTFGTKDSIDKAARKLVKKMYLSDDGKSMKVLYVDKIGVDFCKGYLATFPTAMQDLEAKLYHRQGIND